ncbi:MAG: methyl-accepting chemotaxis protein [Prochloraceae cyanobacterium]
MSNSLNDPANEREEQKKPTNQSEYDSTQIDRDSAPELLNFPPRSPRETETNLSLNLNKWFKNLPVQKKQFLSLILSDLISVVGLFLVGEALINTWGEKEIIERSRAELTVTVDKYQNKIQQMGFSFKLLASNDSIVTAAKSGQDIDPDLRAKIKERLKEKTEILQIEYATLVDKELRIIANANQNRANQIFSPNGLVEQLFKNRDIQQIQANGIVEWAELQQEKPPLPKGFSEPEALIRYTITPVKNPENNRTIGALISGDIINNKIEIPQSILEDFNGGYSGIYLLKPDGQTALATGIYQSKSQTIKEADRAAVLPDTAIIQEARKAPNKIKTGKINSQGQEYIVSAIALPAEYQQRFDDGSKIIFDDRPVAILLRGTPTTSLQELRTTYYFLHFLILVPVVILVNWIIAILLRQTIATPIDRLRQTTISFIKGDRLARSGIDSYDEVGQLSNAFDHLADKIVKSQTKLSRSATQSMLLERLASARDSQELESALNRILSQIRHTISVDRAIIYKFDRDWQGTITAESVVPGFPRSIGKQIVDPCFEEKYAEQYQKGRVKAVDNVYEAGLTECYLKSIEPLAVKAYLIVPVQTARNLYGLLIVHQCASPHQWQQSEIDYLAKFASEIGWSLNAFLLLEEKQAEAARERENSSYLQQELLQLVNDVESLSQGDLTVHAEMEGSEIGIVADLLNSAVSNLRDVVALVKKSAAEVNESIAENQNTIHVLAERTSQQTNRIDRTLEYVQKMTVSITQVADNAKAAARVASSASLTANQGGEAMERTVKSILQVQDTILITAKKVKQLGQSSQQIAKAISLINQIALKTKVLAVNAGIEAGRAGEEGQGFVIVAEEVGKLAAQSATATKQIEQIVENIQIEASELAKTMKIGTAQIQEGTNLLKDTKNNLVRLVEVSQKIDRLVDSISSATISQAQTSQSVNNLMQEIAKVSQETSQSSYQVSHSLQQTVEIAQRLQSFVKSYKIKN